MSKITYDILVDCGKRSKVPMNRFQLLVEAFGACSRGRIALGAQSFTKFMRNPKSNWDDMRWLVRQCYIRDYCIPSKELSKFTKLWERMCQAAENGERFELTLAELKLIHRQLLRLEHTLEETISANNATRAQRRSIRLSRGW